MIIFSKIFGAKCAVCGKRAMQPRNYLDDKGRPIKVCASCVPYAERRAFRKK
jgi:uncharacterized OB-fold protein